MQKVDYKKIESRKADFQATSVTPIFKLVLLSTNLYICISQLYKL